MPSRWAASTSRRRSSGRPVAAGRGEQGHAVVAPAPVPGEVGHGHQLDGRHPEVAQRPQPPGGPREGPLGAERADVQLVDDQVLGGDAPASPRRAQAKRPGSTTSEGPWTPSGWYREAGSGNGPRAVDPVAVAVAGADALDQPAERPVGRLLQRPDRRRSRRPLDHHLDPRASGAQTRNRVPAASGQAPSDGRQTDPATVRGVAPSVILMTASPPRHVSGRPVPGAGDDRLGKRGAGTREVPGETPPSVCCCKDNSLIGLIDVL